jgi:hypothetical protein
MSDVRSLAHTYQAARERLDSLSALLADGKGAETLAKLQIRIAVKEPNRAPVGVEAVADALAAAVRDDMDRYVSAVLIRAQDAVTKAASALRDAVDRDLKSQNMRD